MTIQQLIQRLKQATGEPWTYETTTYQNGIERYDIILHEKYIYNVTKGFLDLLILHSKETKHLVDRIIKKSYNAPL
jgi:hypothetical protein